MVAYLNKDKHMLAQFERYTIQYVLRDQNSNVEALAKLASKKDKDTLNFLLVQYLSSPSINVEENTLIIRVVNT